MYHSKSPPNSNVIHGARPEWIQSNDWSRLVRSVSQQNWPKIETELKECPDKWREWYAGSVKTGIYQISCTVAAMVLAVGLRPDRLALILRDFVKSEVFDGRGISGMRIPDTG